MKHTLNETIAILRKQRGMTQEELATVLGVSGQAVSKWESGVCCPDIGLLPALADTFGVTLDVLFGREAPTVATESPTELLGRHMASLPDGEACVLAAQTAFALHARLVVSMMKMPDPEETVAHALVGEWGMSSISVEKLTTRMYRDAVFFSANGEHGSTWMSPEEVWQLRSLLKDLTDGDHLRVLLSLYRLTVRDEELYVPVSAIAQHGGLSDEAVQAALDGGLRRMVACRFIDGTPCWHIRGESMDMIPILSLLNGH